MSRPRVAVLGLGIIGSGIAGRVQAAGFPLAVFNRNREKAARFASAGATVAGSPKDAAAQADIVLCAVADDAASREIWFGDNGALAGAAAGSVLIESSTLTVGWVQELAKAAAERKCEFLDAPVTGSKPHAVAGQLLFLVGGPATALDAARPVFAVAGRDVIHVGGPGSGARLKLINNFMSGVQAASLAEAAAMIRKGGIDAEKAFAVLTNGAPGSPLVKTLAERVNKGDTEVNFELRLMAKDLGYAIDDAARNKVTLEVGGAALSVFKRAVAEGHGNRDFSAVVASTRER